MRDWIFSTKVKDKSNKTKQLDLLTAGYVKIVRHVKIRGDANPFDPKYTKYFKMRDARYSGNKCAA